MKHKTVLILLGIFIYSTIFVAAESDPSKISQDNVSLVKGKIPTTEIQKGKREAWFMDWDFCTDNSNNSAVDKNNLKKGHIYFHGFFDERGWVKELRYYDQTGTHRWTKVFTYSFEINNMTEYLPRSYKYLTPDGKIIDHEKQEKIVKSKAWSNGTPKREIIQTLGEPLVVTTDSFGMEKVIYFDGINQHWYTFNKDGKLDYSNYKE